jgi:phage FluMu gp28-like protein
VSDLPTVLLPYQAEAIALSHRHDLFVVEKSRRTGLTYGFAADAVLTAAAEYRPQDVFYIAYNLDMTREFVGYCGDFAKAFNQAATFSDEFLFDDGSEEGIKAFRVDFPSGKSIVALSSKPRSLRGTQGGVISTHDGADNPFNELIENIRAGKRQGAVFRIDIEQALAQGLYKRICLRAGKPWTPAAEAAWLESLKATYGEAADEELYCIPARGSGTYLARAAILGAMSERHEVIRMRCPDDFVTWPQARAADWVGEWFDETLKHRLAALDPRRRSYFGQDFARSADLTAIAVGQLDALLVLQVPFILELRNVPFREQEWILSSIIRRLPLFTAGKMDARGNGQSLAEAMQRDFGADRIEPVMSTQGTYLDGFPKLKAHIEARTIVLPRDEAVLDDHRMVKLVRGVPMIPDRSADKTDGAKGRRHGDTAIATMMLTLAAAEDLAPIDLHTLPDRRPSADDYDFTARGFGTVRRASSDLDI